MTHPIDNLGGGMHGRQSGDGVFLRTGSKDGVESNKKNLISFPKKTKLTSDLSKRQSGCSHTALADT